MEGVSGVRGFLDRVWRMIIDDRAEQMALNAAVHDAEPTRRAEPRAAQDDQAVTRDIERMAFNTAIARMMEFTNFFFKESVRPRAAMERFVLLLSPFAPHLAEELWQLLGHDETLAYEPWPEFDEALLKRGHGRDSGAGQRQAARPDHGARRRRRRRHLKRPPGPTTRVAELLGGQDGRQGDRGPGPDGEFRGEVKARAYITPLAPREMRSRPCCSAGPESRRLPSRASRGTRNT